MNGNHPWDADDMGDSTPWVCDDGTRTAVGASEDTPECWGHGHDYEPRSPSERGES